MYFRVTEITWWIFPNTLATTKGKMFWKCWAYLLQIQQNSTPLKKKYLLTVYSSSSRINYKYFHNITFSSSCNKHLPTNKLMLDLQTTVPCYPSHPPHCGESTWSWLHYSCPTWEVVEIPVSTATLNLLKDGGCSWCAMECWELAPQPLQQQWKPCTLHLVQACTSLNSENFTFLCKGKPTHFWKCQCN